MALIFLFLTVPELSNGNACKIEHFLILYCASTSLFCDHHCLLLTHFWFHLNNLKSGPSADRLELQDNDNLEKLLSRRAEKLSTFQARQHPQLVILTPPYQFASEKIMLKIWCPEVPGRKSRERNRENEHATSRCTERLMLAPGLRSRHRLFPREKTDMENRILLQKSSKPKNQRHGSTFEYFLS